MIENDYIKELFSKSLGNQAAPVRPEVWNGLQAKMAAAGIASTAATKGLSVLAKWLIGSAAVTGTAVITTIAVMNAGEQEPKKGAVVTEQVAQEPSVETNASEEQPQTADIQESGPVAASGGNDNELPDPVTTGVRTEPSTEIIPAGSPERRSLIVRPESPLQPVVVPEPEVREPKETHVSQPLVIEKEPVNTANEGNDPNFKAPKLHFPNVFTPNGDHANDEYFIAFENVSAVKVNIMDQKGQDVFVTEDKNFRWDGTFQGSGDPVPNGTYACIVIYRDLAGKSHKEITLIDIRR